MPLVAVILYKLGFPHLLGKGGGVPQLDSQTMKALGCEEVNMEELLIDISKSNMKSSYALP